MKKSEVYESPVSYELRARIKGSKPPIWRKLSVPGHYDLEDLHVILQIAFGWEDEHLHLFIIDSVRYGAADLDAAIDESSVRLDDLLRENQKFIYLYDFGDSWAHEITVSKVCEADILPHCLDGKRAGPLEDSGGIWGYMEMIKILKDPEDDRYEDMHEWAGDIDPESFSPSEVDFHLEYTFRDSPSRKTSSRGSEEFW